MGRRGDRRPGQLVLNLFAPLGRALRHRPFRAFILGQSVSLVGTWMQQVAVAWAAFQLTHSAAVLGLVGFASQAPTFFLAPVGGALADRRSRRHLVLSTQFLMMVQASLLFYLSLTGALSVQALVIASLAMGVLNAFDVPARQSFLLEMVGAKDDLGTAIAVNSSVFNLARLVGPSIGGLILAVGGPVWCFGLNAVSYLAVLAALWTMKPARPRVLEPAHESFFESVRGGFGQLRENAQLRRVVLLLAFAGFLGMPFSALLPMVADQFLGGGARMLGFLYGATGFGAFLGAFSLAMREDRKRLLRHAAFSAFIFGTALVLFSFSRNFWVSWMLLVVAGFGTMSQTLATNIYLQTMVGEGFRGRVMSFFTMALMGTAPFGCLLAGYFAEKTGVDSALFWGGSLTALAAVFFAYRLHREARKS